MDSLSFHLVQIPPVRSTATQSQAQLTTLYSFKGKGDGNQPSAAVIGDGHGIERLEFEADEARRTAEQASRDREGIALSNRVTAILAAMQEKRERWMELAELAAAEQDPDKLTELVP